MPVRGRSILILLLAVGFGPPARALTVRVEASSGAPRLVVNGVPVRARMFWGAPGTSPLPVSAKPQEITFEFTATGAAANGTMHFRFGAEPGEIWLDDIRVEDLDATAARPLVASDFEGGAESYTRDWTTWPTGAANTVGRVEVATPPGAGASAALHVRLQAPANGSWPDFHVYHQPRLPIVNGHRYRVRFRAWAEPARTLTVALYRPGPSYVLLGGPPGRYESQIRLAANVGVDLVSFPIPMPWPAPGEAEDWSAVDEACAQVLRANPRALLLPRMGMDPPPWWQKAHPDDVMQWEDGRRDAAVVASPVYRREAAARLAALVTHLEQSFGDHVAGYHPCGQNTGEWFYHDTWKRPLNGYAPADLAAWRVWLRGHYGDVEKLRRAWSDQAATFGTARVPTPAARHAAPSGLLRDPQSERPLIDWAQFQQDAMADCVLELAHAARTASQGRKLVVFFYGYVFEFGAIENGPATAGHYALRRALDCPDIDVLCSPISYNDRGIGQSAPAMSAAESVALAGKLWLNEDDTHTFLATGTQPGWQEHAPSLEATNHELLRNLAQESFRNFGTWWMDLGATGWFDHPGMWAVMEKMRAVDEAMLKTPAPYRPEVAAVIDERPMWRVAAGGPRVTRPCVYDARIGLGRMGAPYGQYLLDDVAEGRVGAKLYVFLNAWCLDAEQRSKLLAATRGATRVWCYAPGAHEDERPAPPSALRELTGFDLRPVSLPSAIATPTAAGKRLGLTAALGVETPVRPLFAAADARGDEVLATYPDGSAAVALRRTPTGPSLFVGVPGLPSELLRLAADAGGVHLFTRVDCNVYANARFLALHASGDGPVEVETGASDGVVDVMTGEKLGKGPRVTVPIRRGETRVLRY